jgi:hypothetical protein
MSWHPTLDSMIRAWAVGSRDASDYMQWWTEPSQAQTSPAKVHYILHLDSSQSVMVPIQCLYSVVAFLSHVQSLYGRDFSKLCHFETTMFQKMLILLGQAIDHGNLISKVIYRVVFENHGMLRFWETGLSLTTVQSMTLQVIEHTCRNYDSIRWAAADVSHCRFWFWWWFSLNPHVCQPSFRIGTLMSTTTTKANNSAMRHASSCWSWFWCGVSPLLASFSFAISPSINLGEKTCPGVPAG